MNLPWSKPGITTDDQRFGFHARIEGTVLACQEHPQLKDVWVVAARVHLHHAFRFAARNPLLPNQTFSATIIDGPALPDPATGADVETCYLDHVALTAAVPQISQRNLSEAEKAYRDMMTPEPPAPRTLGYF